MKFVSQLFQLHVILKYLSKEYVFCLLIVSLWPDYLFGFGIFLLYFRSLYIICLKSFRKRKDTKPNKLNGNRNTLSSPQLPRTLGAPCEAQLSAIGRSKWAKEDQLPNMPFSKRGLSQGASLPWPQCMEGLLSSQSSLELPFVLVSLTCKSHHSTCHKVSGDGEDPNVTNVLWGCVCRAVLDVKSAHSLPWNPTSLS